MSTVEQLVQETFAGMDPVTGMFPQHDCYQCRTPLNADGGHPAELYAGTYTGLCYRCQNGPVYVEAYYPFDGAIVLNYAPHCPSWRRDRELYTAYPDCQECRGRGMLWVSRAMSMGGSYRSFCNTCSNRFHFHPTRNHHSKRVSRIYSAAQNLFRKKVKGKERYAKRRGREVSDAVIEQLRQEFLARHAKAMERYERLRDRSGVFQRLPPLPEHIEWLAQLREANPYTRW